MHSDKIVAANPGLRAIDPTRLVKVAKNTSSKYSWNQTGLKLFYTNLEFNFKQRPHEDLNSSDHTPSCLPSSTSSLCDNQLQQSFAYVDNNSHQFSQHTQSYLTSYTSSSDTYKKAKFNFQMSNNNNNIITNNNNNNNVSSPPLSVQNNYLAIRNLPSDATDADINQLLTMVTCNPGTVLSMIICKINNQVGYYY